MGLEDISVLNFLGPFQFLYLGLKTAFQHDTFVILELASALLIQQKFIDITI